VHLDESLVAESMAIMRIDIDGETVSPALEEGGSSACQGIFGGCSAAIAGFWWRPTSLKVAKQSVPVRGIHRREFLNPSLSMQPLLSPEVSATSSSSLVGKEAGVVGIPTLLGGCNTPNDEKGEDSKINGLI
jgi:hypothetical protein